MNESEAIKLLKKANRDNDMVGILPKSDIGKCLIKALDVIDAQPTAYDTMMMYEVKDLVDDLLEIVKAGGADA